MVTARKWLLPLERGDLVAGTGRYGMRVLGLDITYMGILHSYVRMGQLPQSSP